MRAKPFYGWWVTAAAICTFGIAVGIPYYNMPFFYDYYEKAVPQGGFGWSRDQITLGFPLAALFTLWVGPLLVHRFSPRKLILAGTALTAAAFVGFSRMSGAIEVYYLFWFVYTVGYIFSGPIPHQVIISQWFRRKRGRAMGITYAGFSVIASINQHMKLVFNDNGFVDQAVLNSTWSTASVLIQWSSIAGRLLVGWMADRFPKKFVMTGTYALVAATIPLLLLVKPGQTEYLYFFAILFGFGIGADYMLIPLMAAEQFGVNTLARAMAIILPTDTIGQTWFPYFVSLLRRYFGDYDHALMSVFAMAVVGAAAIAMLPKYGRQDETLHLQEPGRVAARS